MERLDIQVDEVRQVGEKLLKADKRKKKKRFRKRLKLFILIGALIALGIFYLLSDMSRVKSLTVTGNHVYSDEVVLEKANLNYDSSFILTSSWWVEHTLKNDVLIKNVDVRKNLQGGIEINIEEKMIIGYLQEDTHSLLIQGEGIVQLEEAGEDLIRNIPRISGLNSDQLARLDEAFENVEMQYVHMISEILPFATSYDSDMIQLVMMDGNRVNTSYRGIELINNYKNILAELEGTHVCLYVDEFSGNIIKENGDCSSASQTENEEEIAESDENVSENVQE